MNTHIRSEKKNIVVWALFGVYIVLLNIMLFLTNGVPSRMGGVLQLIPVAVMLCAGLVYSLGRFRPRMGYFDVYILLFGVFCVASSLWAQDGSLAVSKGVDLIETMVIMYIISIALQKAGSIDMFLQTLMLAYYAIVVFEIGFYGWSYIVATLHDSTRVSSEYLNSNTLGICASFAVLINIYLLSVKKTGLWTLALVGISSAVVGASGSRKALLSLMIGVFMLVFLRIIGRKNAMKVMLRLVLTLPIIALLMYAALNLPMFSGVMGRIKSSIGGGNALEKSAMIRLHLRKLGLKLFQGHPLLGVGIDNPRLYTYAVVQDTFYLHNNYLELLAGGGAVGFIAYYWIYARLLYYLIKYRRFKDPQYCICAVLFFLEIIMEYAMVTYYSKSTYVLLLLFVMYTDKLKKQGEGSCG